MILLYSEKFVKLLLLLPAAAGLFAQSAVHVDYACTQEDVDSFGLSCSEDQPCPVFFEISAVDSFGSHIFVAGDIHTATTILYGVLLSTDDGGASWSEAIPRRRGTAFEQFQIIGNNGWLSGHEVDSLSKDPFFLITTDAGKSWHEKALFDDSRFGSIAQFWFDTPATGQLIVDDSVGKTIDQELYATNTGGEGWELREKSTSALHLKTPRPAPTWVATAASGSPHYVIERNATGRKEPFARFLIHIGDCK